MEQQQQHSSESIFQHNNMLIGNLESEFHDPIEEFPFVSASNSFDSDQSLSNSEPDHSNYGSESTVQILSDHTPDSPSSLSSSGLRRRRRPFSHRSSEDISDSQFFKNNPDGLIDFDRHSTSPSQRTKHKRSWSVKDYENLKVKVESPAAQSSGSDGSSPLHVRTTDASSAITSIGSNGRLINDEPITVNSPNSFPILLLTIAELILKSLGFRNQSFANSFNFPIWLMKISYVLVSDPLSIVYQWIEKHKFNLSSCIPTFSGLLWLTYCVFILICCIVLPFLLSGIMMKLIVSQPAQITEELIFDYTRDTPMAFVPIISCSNSSSPELIEKGIESQVLHFDREVQATVSLTLPESDYNRNLGVFQVRVDFLSGDGKPLATIRQPSMFPFRSEPIRLLLTFFKLAPVLAGYSSESQTLDITFKGYTEKNVRTSCSRVVLEQRAEFRKGGGIPEIYAASLKLEARHPYWKRVLWYWKSVIFMAMTTMVFTVELFFMLMCSPIVFSGQRRGGGSSNASRNTPLT